MYRISNDVNGISIWMQRSVSMHIQGFVSSLREVHSKSLIVFESFRPSKHANRTMKVEKFEHTHSPRSGFWALLPVIYTVTRDREVTTKCLGVRREPNLPSRTPMRASWLTSYSWTPKTSCGFRGFTRFVAPKQTLVIKGNQCIILTGWEVTWQT